MTGKTWVIPLFCAVGLGGAVRGTGAAESGAAGPAATSACFLLYEVGVGERRRAPAEACRTPMSPASTFKIPHALVALDAGVVAGPDTEFVYDGSGDWLPSARRNHTLASAIRYSVVWYFQQIAQRLGPERERRYLQALQYGNRDSSSGLTTFWLGGSLLITPQQQLAFMRKLYSNSLPVSPQAMAQVRAMLVQPSGAVVNALGEHPFDAPWPADVVVSAKTGSTTDQSGREVRWLVGQVQRGRREFIFVSCVIGPEELESTAAIALAARALREERVL